MRLAQVCSHPARYAPNAEILMRRPVGQPRTAINIQVWDLPFSMDKSEDVRKTFLSEIEALFHRASEEGRIDVKFGQC